MQAIVFRVHRFLPLLFLLVLGCQAPEEVRRGIVHGSPYERYAHALKEAGLVHTALGQAWQAAGSEALEHPRPITPPHRQAVYFDPAGPEAVGLRFELKRGQEMRVQVAGPPADASLFFVDLFSIPEDTTRAPQPVASADSTRELVVYVRREQAYVLRLQPELLRGGRYTVLVEVGPSLGFPVAGQDSRAIRSYFGDPRDGGRRDHHGVDIFAPKGTPVLAAADGYVTRVHERGLGGKVVWQRDHRGHALYYAHLDTQLVRPNTRVQAGDTLGLVGNTGNARTTPPHLHFGIYESGPLDPFQFLHRPDQTPAAVAIDEKHLGGWVRVAAASAAVHPDPSGRAAFRLPQNVPLRVLGGESGWYRVQLPDGRRGFVQARDTRGADAPLDQFITEAGQPLWLRASASGAMVDSVAAGTTLAVLGVFESHYLVKTPTNRVGWMKAHASAARPVRLHTD